MAGVVVVVEDEMKLRDLIRAFLEREGFTVLTAATGAEGLQFEAKVMPDLVVLDLGLPDIPGEEVARKLGISLTAMKSRLHRARALVRQGIDEQILPSRTRGT